MFCGVQHHHRLLQHCTYSLHSVPGVCGACELEPDTQTIITRLCETEPSQAHCSSTAGRKRLNAAQLSLSLPADRRNTINRNTRRSSRHLRQPHSKLKNVWCGRYLSDKRQSRSRSWPTEASSALHTACCRPTLL